MKPRRLQSATIFSIVTLSRAAASIGGNPSERSRRLLRQFAAWIRHLPGQGAVCRPVGRVRWADMVNLALRATGHVAAWLVWHSMRVSLLGDLPVPRPPGDSP